MEIPIPEGSIGRVVYEKIHRPELLGNFPEHRCHLIAIRNVGANSNCLGPAGCDSADGFLGVVLACAIVERHASPVACQRLADRPPVRF